MKKEQISTTNTKVTKKKSDNDKNQIVLVQKDMKGPLTSVPKKQTKKSKVLAQLIEKPVKPKNYLNNKDLISEFKNSKEVNKMTPKFTNMLVMLCERFARKSNYSGYSYIDDMKGFAILGLVRNWHKFNPEKSNNAFAYYSECISNSFNQFLNSEKRHRSIRDELLLEQGMNPSNTYMTEYEQSHNEEYHLDDEVVVETDNDIVEHETEITSGERDVLISEGGLFD